jgi:uncharacterized protein YaiI (UPF0178 family)
VITILIDADACPVKDEVYRVAERHLARGLAVKVAVVSNSGIAVPRADFIARVVVPAGLDAADDWIAERADAKAIVVTQDIPLAARASCRRGGDRAERARVHRGIHRTRAGAAQPDG